MVVERRDEVPGYNWYHVENFDLFLPLPKDWTVISSSDEKSTKIAMAEEFLNDAGFYRTGLTLTATKDLEEVEKVSGEKFVRESLKHISTLAPNDDLETIEDHPLIMARRSFITREAYVDFKSQSITEIFRVPISFCYFMMAFNANTGTGYLARSITPLAEIDDSQNIEGKALRYGIGKSIINNIQINKAV